MKQVIVNRGKAFSDTVPVKQVESKFVKVKTYYSCISMGTELASMVSSGKTLLERIIENPNKIIKGLKSLYNNGITKTCDNITESSNKIDLPGYSASGIVEEVGSDVVGIKPGDKVACAGGHYATHSECIVVPQNLVVKLNDKSDLRAASSVAIGSIAMQGVRRADVKLGENICVIGLGLIGQLTIQILQAAGAHVIAVDVNDTRIEEVKQLGVDIAINSSNEDFYNKINDFTNGKGVDSVIITAATKTSEPLHQAFSICRKKGRVVLVGVVDININREDMYKKELEFLISTSYGPGRYDANYEENGFDYPYHWVRFTENRNMQEYIRLLDNGKIKIDYMFAPDASIEDAEQVFDNLLHNNKRPLLQAFRYSNDETIICDSKIIVNDIPSKEGIINVSVCGAGGFAKAFHLPNLSKIEGYKIYAIMTRDGANAKKIAKDYSAKYATTNYSDIIEDKNVDVVMITTRHNLHFDYVIKALQANKTVFVEKPLCLTQKQLDYIKEELQNSKAGLMVGYNRRFSPHSLFVKKHLENRINPMVINYIMNAGYIPPENWVHTEEGGGRIIGEACHIIDLFTFFTEEKPTNIFVNSLSPNTSNVQSNDNKVISIKFDKGSIATLTYCSNGSRDYPKESCQIFCDNHTYIINDFKKEFVLAKF